MNKKSSLLSGILIGIAVSSLLIWQQEITLFAVAYNNYEEDLTYSTNDYFTYYKQKDLILEKQGLLAVNKAKERIEKERLRLEALRKEKERKEKERQLALSRSLVTKKGVELLDWWKSARYVFKTNMVATVVDVRTGRTFKIKRTMGSNHADCEALTLQDTKIIKSIWGGFTWTTRPVYIIVNGRKLAASMSSLPHAGVDSAPAFKVVNNRSEGYGRGQNLDVVKNNGMNGHFDVHFLNSTRHKDGKIDPKHQASIREAAR